MPFHKFDSKIATEIRKKFSIGNRVVVTDALTPSNYISGVVASQPQAFTNEIGIDFSYDILVDFSDEMLIDGDIYKRITVPSDYLTLI